MAYQAAYHILRDRLSRMLTTWDLSPYQKEVIAADLSQAERLAISADLSKAEHLAVRPARAPGLVEDQEPTSPAAPSARRRLQAVP